MVAAALRQAFSRTWALLALGLGHLCAIRFLGDLSESVEAISDPEARRFAVLLNGLIQNLFLGLAPLRAAFVLLLLVLLWRTLRGRPLRFGEDLIGALLCVRCAVQFVLMNLLLLAPLREGASMLRLLLLFLPLVTLAFGWLYYRLDTGARRQGRSHITFNDAGEQLDCFDYFYISAVTLLQFEPSGSSANTRLMKSLFVLHGVVMLDLVALALSRAIGLAGGG
ncbi:hypothetical protein NZK27_08790 [Synechococcus sp. FGCU-3]|nr:hypothetical protein [Synechococcus sp. FGCU3]